MHEYYDIFQKGATECQTVLRIKTSSEHDTPKGTTSAADTKKGVMFKEVHHNEPVTMTQSSTGATEAPVDFVSVEPLLPEKHLHIVASCQDSKQRRWKYPYLHSCMIRNNAVANDLEIWAFVPPRYHVGYDRYAYLMSTKRLPWQHEVRQLDSNGEYARPAGLHRR
jgi:hypothetical protein